MVCEDKYSMVDSYKQDIQFTDEQKKCIDYDSKTALVIKGTAGSGKSMMVIKRAIDYRQEIVQSGGGRTVCIMTYTKTLAQGIRDILERNGISIKSSWNPNNQDQDMVADQYMSVTNVDSYLAMLCRKMGTLPRNERPSQDCNYRYNPKIKTVSRNEQISSKQRIEMINQVLRDLSQKDDHPYYHRSPEFWADEILWMYQNGIVDDDDELEYMNINRDGRCKQYNIRMGKNGRRAAFKIFVGYNRLLVKGNHMEWDREYANFLRFKGGQIPDQYKFDYLLIDEAQDLSLVKMKILKELCNEELNIAMDKNQSIYGHRWSFKRDLEITTHVKKLSVMFRGTQEIDKFSMDLKKADDTLLDEEDIYSNEVSPKVSKILPKIVKCVDPASEMEFIVNETKALIQKPNANVAILCLDYEHLYQFQQALSREGIPAEFFRDNDFRPLTGGVKLITTYSAKGLGFLNVIIPYFTDGVYPKSTENIISSLVNNQDEDSEGIDYDDAIAEEVSSSRRLIYVGITRAMANVILTYSSKPSRFINEFDPSHYNLIDESHKPTSDDRIRYVPIAASIKVTRPEILHPSNEVVKQPPIIGKSHDIMIDVLIAEGIEYNDRRDKNGVLWIMDGPATRKIICELEKQGYRFGFTPRGSRSTNHRPAYYYDG